jgi:hypothetical protein
MSRKSDQRQRERFRTREPLYAVPPRTIYVYAHNWSTATAGKQFCVAARHRRERAYWAESKSVKTSLEEALQSAEVWRLRAEASNGVAYKVVVTPSVVLTLIARSGGNPGPSTGTTAVTSAQMQQPDRWIWADVPIDCKAVYDCALLRKRTNVPPGLIPAIEAMLMSGEYGRARLVIDYLGWNPNEAALPGSLEDLLPVAVHLHEAEDAEREAGEEHTRHDG